MDNKYESVCRVCLVKDTSSAMRPLADKQTRDLLIECTSIWVTPEDTYPQQLCMKCWKECKRCSAFQSMARNSARHLRLEIEVEEEKDVANEDSVIIKKEVVEEKNILKVKEELMDEDDENTMEEIEEPLEKELVQENCHADRLKLQNGNKKMCEREEVTVKEEDMDEDEIKLEQLEYLQGYSLAPDSRDEEDSIPLVSDSETRQNNAPQEPSAFKANKCGYCAKTFFRLASLVAHVRVHKTNFECILCSKTFRSNHQLKVHQLTHNAIKTIDFDKRDPMCTPETNSANHKLLVVQNIEPEGTPVKWTTETMEGHSVKVSKCGYCAKTYKNLASLIAHARVHTKKKYFQCGRCCKWFRDKNLLKTHQLTHIENTKLFECKERHEKFRSKMKWELHIRTQHAAIKIRKPVMDNNQKIVNLVSRLKQKHAEFRGNSHTL